MSFLAPRPPARIESGVQLRDLSAPAFAQKAPNPGLSASTSVTACPRCWRSGRTGPAVAARSPSTFPYRRQSASVDAPPMLKFAPEVAPDLITGV